MNENIRDDARGPAARNPAEATVPWWRVRMVWLVIGGPALVVVAAFVTLALALRHPDPVITTPPQAGAAAAAETPAVQARNHAATPQR